LGFLGARMLFLVRGRWSVGLFARLSTGREALSGRGGFSDGRLGGGSGVGWFLGGGVFREFLGETVSGGLSDGFCRMAAPGWGVVHTRGVWVLGGFLLGVGVFFVSPWLEGRRAVLWWGVFGGVFLCGLVVFFFRFLCFRLGGGAFVKALRPPQCLFPNITFQDCLGTGFPSNRPLLGFLPPFFFWAGPIF